MRTVVILSSTFMLIALMLCYFMKREADEDLRWIYTFIAMCFIVAAMGCNVVLQGMICF